jgi:hypothetical protein
VSEVIEDFIRQHQGLSENEAFEGFAAQERIRTWLGNDATRRDRLRREFARTWADLESRGGAAAMVRPVALAPPTSVPVVRRAAAPPRLLKVLCPACETMQVWAEDARIACRGCGREYPDMLELVPAKPVGLFAFVFGEGAAGWVAAGGVAVLLVLLYLAATRL